MFVGIIVIYIILYFSKWLTSVLHSSACCFWGFFGVFFKQKTAASFWESETGFNSYDVSSDHVRCFYHDPRRLCCTSTQTRKRLVYGGTVSDII